ncbi:MAG TPA: MerR family transcriptional regulator [Flavobacteriales bacterium]|jgi:DNA-binding transcriptional MerR regulator|nr:MerR family transcriptional regulator [Flavobacteriales bacterium]
MSTAAPSLFSDRFSIKDLELFSGVKAHTIRMWERRYRLLSPARSTTNIRSYGIDDLKTLLNTALLVKEGEPISRVAALSALGRDERVRSMAGAKWADDEALNAMKLAMLTYDEALFERTSGAFRIDHGFDGLVERLYLPLLQLVGLLWQSNTICPAQEHFVSNLIRQKLVSAIDTLPIVAVDPLPLVVLYLPENEIHELGLLYLHYRLRRAGRRTLYLGQSVPIADLADVARHWAGPLDVCAVCTAFPQGNDAARYLNELVTALDRSDIRVHLTGARTPGGELPEGVQRYDSVPALAEAVVHGR